MQPSSSNFKPNAAAALADSTLQRALAKARSGFQSKRARARSELPEFDALCEQAKDIKNHTLAHLDLYLEIFEQKVTESGGRVHWARTPEQARKLILGICKEAGAHTITKGKSMVAEEIALNPALEAAGFQPVETDLGEYIVQIRKEVPSHIIAPAFHLTREQVEADFRRTHLDLDKDRSLTKPEELVAEARGILRDKFVKADVGITGANFLVAETGSSVIVTNEGNADLTHLLPRVHIVLTTIEKLVPNLSDVSGILRVLARSATGQDISMYTTFMTGPRRPGDPDGPEAYHVVLLDNGRSEMLGAEFQDMLRCIRCGSCINHCPVYGAVGGHAYGWVYPGPMGAVLTPSLIGVHEAGHLPNASSFCGRCEAVCPMKIPLPKMMRHWREREFEQGESPRIQRMSIKAWSWLARRPQLYRRVMGPLIGLLGEWGKRRGNFRWLPMAGQWLKHRDLAAPAGRSFHELWQLEQNRRIREADIRR
ncbi:MAG: iron-sulfur cluster-binding protein [Hyphomicrobiales bacterium]|nr:iron-sulfur cluster-binding protein [Hyphomicrobiales bacterium]